MSSTTVSPSNPLVDGDPPSVDVPEPTLGRLRRLNIAAGILHLVSAVVMTIIAADFTLPITSFNLNGPPCYHCANTSNCFAT